MLFSACTAYVDPPEGTTLTNAASNTVLQGDQVTFTCKVRHSNPGVDQYKFYFKNSSTWALKDQNQDGTYRINNVQGSDHGKYKCVPHNAAGNGEESTVMLTVNGEFILNSTRTEYLFLSFVSIS